MFLEEGAQEQAQVLNEVLLVVLAVGVRKADVGVQGKHLLQEEGTIILVRPCFPRGPTFTAVMLGQGQKHNAVGMSKKKKKKKHPADRP